MADLDATTSIIGALVNGAAISAQRALLEREEMKTLKKDLTINYFSERDVVTRKRKELVFQLWWILLFHLVNLAIFAGMIVFLVVGPEKLSQYFPRIQASPLTSTARILLWVWLIISGLTYVALCFWPTIKLLQLVHKARQWLKK